MKYYVYIIQNAKGHCKIGFSRDPERRLKEMQTANSRKLKIKKVWKFYSKKKAREIEREAHSRFENFKSESEGEWFEVSCKKAKNYINKIK
jgi:predicted GIY-YIG superfamily endonuclease